MFYVEVRERMCQTFVPPVIRYKVGLSHFIDIVHLVYNKEGIAPDFESSDCQLPSQLHSHNPDTPQRCWNTVRGERTNAGEDALLV